MSASAKVVSVLKGPAGWAIAIIAGAAVVYWIGSKVKENIVGTKTPGTGGNGYTGGVNGALFGTSDLQTSTNLDGTAQTSYTGHGAVGTLGATANNVSGGALSSLGENIGGWLYDLTHLDYQP